MTTRQKFCFKKDEFEDGVLPKSLKSPVGSLQPILTSNHLILM
jgi:hypothetical protein